jgi:hypothetical protein
MKDKAAHLAKELAKSGTEPILPSMQPSTNENRNKPSFEGTPSAGNTDKRTMKARKMKRNRRKNSR